MKTLTGCELMKTGWLDVTGHLHECGEYSHMSKAHELQMANNYPDICDKTGRLVYGDDVLLEHGWVYIGYSPSCMLGPPEWRINWKYRLHLSLLRKKNSWNLILKKRTSVKSAETFGMMNCFAKLAE